jgi:CRP-like cAMP-binding protein
VISTVEKVLFLKSVDLFARVAGEELSAVAAITNVIEQDAGEVVFREGDVGDALFIVVAGEVRIQSLGVSEDLAVLRERQVFGEMALLDDDPRSATATAKTDVRLLRVEREDFRELLVEKPDIALGIIQVLTKRLRESLNQRRRPESSNPVMRPSS